MTNLGLSRFVYDTTWQECKSLLRGLCRHHILANRNLLLIGTYLTVIEPLYVCKNVCGALHMCGTIGEPLDPEII